MVEPHARISSKSYGVAVCLSGIFGVLGIHHFYLGRPVIGLLDLGLTVAVIYCFSTDRPLLGAVLLLLDVGHTLVVTIVLLVGAYRDGEGAVVAYPGQFQRRTR